jgi:OFA family oxalate/formate antiporter-like MFS transporter
MGFGFASLIAGPVIQLLIAGYGLVATFVILGGAYLLIMAPSALYLGGPQDAPQPAAAADGAARAGAPQLTAAAAMRTWRFYALWWLLFINITCGIGLLSVISPLAQEVVRLSPLAAAAMVGIVGLTNGLGRLAWAAASDYLGRKQYLYRFFRHPGGGVFPLARTSGSTAFQVLVYVIISCYGGGFATIPAFLSDIFGTKALSAIHGRILTAWAAGGSPARCWWRGRGRRPAAIARR